ncbi:UNVERIFIED_CONTAM: hypothetical protein GTU68_025101 [Idotea baltica]|nr:hypothetical protein [Idotea baltica]
MMIENVDQRSKDYSEIRDSYRPGHADYTYDAKYGVRDYRGGGRSSARETANRVAAGAVARQVLGDTIQIKGAVVQIEMAAQWETFLDETRKSGSSVGAIVEVQASGIPAGWGAPVYGKLDAELAGAMMSINAAKGVEIGAGFAAASFSGEENADQMRSGNEGPRFLSNNNGGVAGGISTGQDVVVRLAIKRHLLHPHRSKIHHQARRRHKRPHQRPPRPLRRHPSRPRRRSHARLCARRCEIKASRTSWRMKTAWPLIATVGMIYSVVACGAKPEPAPPEGVHPPTAPKEIPGSVCYGNGAILGEKVVVRLSAENERLVVYLRKISGTRLIGPTEFGARHDGELIMFWKLDENGDRIEGTEEVLIPEDDHLKLGRWKLEKTRCDPHIWND